MNDFKQVFCLLALKNVQLGNKFPKNITFEVACIAILVEATTCDGDVLILFSANFQSDLYAV